MRKIFGLVKSGAFVVFWAVISSVIYGVMVRLDYIDGVAEWMVVKFSDMNAENVKHLFSVTSYLAFVFCISLALSIIVWWFAKKIVARLPSNRLRNMHNSIRTICQRYYFLMDESRSGLSLSSNSNILRVSFIEESNEVIRRLERICKIKMPSEEPFAFLNYILPPVSRGDVIRVRQISEVWDRELANEFKETNRRRSRY